MPITQALGRLSGRHMSGGWSEQYRETLSQIKMTIRTTIAKSENIHTIYIKNISLDA